MVFRIGFFTFFAAFSLIIHAVYSEDEDPGVEQRDIEALRDWINTKRQVTVRERGGNLSLSGEVRAELQSTNEKINGIKQRGSGGAVSDTPIRAWDVEVNLLLDYRTDRTWAAVKLEFDNNAGKETGTFDHLSLERAYLGGRLVNGDTYTIDLWAGRWSLYYVFDSKIQFSSFMDGLLFKYDQAWDEVGSFFVHAGPFLISEDLDHYGYVGEVALLDIAQTGLYSKLSYIDWDTKHLGGKVKPILTASEEKHIIHDRRFRFRNLQLTLGYKCIPVWLDKVVTIYAAGLMNTAAKRLEVTRNHRENFASYVGISAGQLRKQWDWSFDINYQWVQAQSVPSFDALGVGRVRNAGKVGFYSTESKGKGSLHRTPSQPIGKTNYQGISIEFLYLLFENITIYQAWLQSRRLSSGIGPAVTAKQYEIEIIYGF